MSAHHTLYLLHCGYLFDLDDTDRRNKVPVPAYLIISARGKRYLVDTGNPAGMIGATSCDPWYHAGCEITPADDPIARLAALGMASQQVDAIIATHFDFDHAGRYDVFGPLGTDVWVQRAHIGSALSNPDRYYAALWNIPGLRWHQLDGDFEIEPGLHLIRTDGHAVGHQSLMIETETGPVILAADAIDTRRMMEERTFADYYDAERTNSSIDRLAALSAETGAEIIFGHDREQWSTLPMSPEPFRRR